MLFDETGLFTRHRTLLSKTQLTTSLFFNVAETKTLLLLPVFKPFTCHLYNGLVPALTTAALNCTGVPAQINVSSADIFMLVSVFEMVRMITLLLVDTNASGQRLALLVILQLTLSLSFNADVV